MGGKFTVYGFPNMNGERAVLPCLSFSVPMYSLWIKLGSDRFSLFLAEAVCEECN